MIHLPEESWFASFMMWIGPYAPEYILHDIFAAFELSVSVLAVMYSFSDYRPKI